MLCFPFWHIIKNLYILWCFLFTCPEVKEEQTASETEDGGSVIVGVVEELIPSFPKRCVASPFRIAKCRMFIVSLFMIVLIWIEIPCNTKKVLHGLQYVPLTHNFSFHFFFFFVFLPFYLFNFFIQRLRLKVYF